ncbi:MAG: ABC transporter ATP-binding protein [Beijerinckiaceae bacterium]
MAEFLRLEGLSAGYGAAIIIPPTDLILQEGRSLAILGRNGVGKTTLLNSMIGVTDHHGGRILFRGQDITQLSPDERAAKGIGWVPQERNIFRSLTVIENLAAVERPGAWNPLRIFEMFPRLAERRHNLGHQLSGGEQQMLAIGRALVLNPKILLLDEPTEGLAPIIVEQLLATLHRLLHDEGIAAIIIEQHARKILALTDDAIILERGRIVHQSESATLLTQPDILDQYLGIGSQSVNP